ncbi:MAG: thiamine pyrophosphate-binding protein [Planctomycetaceae bacterium]
MFTGEQVVAQLRRMGITHAVWLPDSTLGRWEKALDEAHDLTLVRVCREAEAWAVAAGLYLAGARPMVIIQCTGLFDSGDSLRNAIFEYGLPLFAAIGYRSYLLAESTDTAKTFAEPVLKAWGLDYRLIDAPQKLADWSTHYDACRQAGRAGAVLIAEGGM